MAIESDVAMARAIEKARHRQVYVSGDRVILMLFGAFSQVQTADLLHVETELFAMRQAAGTYESFPAAIMAVERSGDGLLCVIESLSARFAWWRFTEFFIRFRSGSGSDLYVLKVGIYRQGDDEICA